MADIKASYGASSAVTISLAGLASDTNLLAGVESDAVDNSTDLCLDYQLAGKITTGTSPTASKRIRVHVVGMLNDSTWPDVFDGTGSAETITSADIRDAAGGSIRLAAEMPTSNTSDRAYPFGPISVAALFNGVCPRKFAVFVTHDTGVNLNSTAGNHAVYVTPYKETVA